MRSRAKECLLDGVEGPGESDISSSALYPYLVSKVYADILCHFLNAGFIYVEVIARYFIIIGSSSPIQV